MDALTDPRRGPAAARRTAAQNKKQNCRPEVPIPAATDVTEGGLPPSLLAFVWF